MEKNCGSCMHYNGGLFDGNICNDCRGALTGFANWAPRPEAQAAMAGYVNGLVDARPADELESLRAENAKLKAELASANGKLDSQRLQTERAQAELASARAEVDAYRNQEPVGKVVDTDMLGTPIVRWQRLPNMAEFLFTNQIEVKQK